MKLPVLILFIALSISTKSIAQNIKFINGKWFTGSTFVDKTVYTVDGILRASAPYKVDSVIDLSEQFVIPPFGEAHNHNVRKYSRFKSLSDQYLADGIYYVKNPNCLSGTKRDLLESNLINTTNTIEAVFANGGFTGKDGHPIGVVNINKMRGQWTDAEGDGNFYHAINSQSELNNKWQNVLSEEPDFIKVYLLFSEEFGKRENNKAYLGFKGLHPDLVKEVVSKAHAAGLRVSAHIETAMDFHHAIMAGVDEMSHTPGFRGDPMLNEKASSSDYERFPIREEDAKLAAQKGIVVVTTMSGVEQLPFYVPMKWRVKSVHEKNLKILKHHHVKIAFGSDSFDTNSLAELDYVADTGIFSDLELLKILCETTPETIFPGRKIGKLIEGYEANFIVLKNNPIKNIQAVKNITLWVKQGYILNGLTKAEL